MTASVNTNSEASEEEGSFDLSNLKKQIKNLTKELVNQKRVTQVLQVISDNAYSYAKSKTVSNIFVEPDP